MEGQLCYSLDVNNITRAKPKAGRAMGLMLLLDRMNPDPEQLENEVHDSYRVILNTLDGFSDTQDGSYRMINVKKMLGTKSFMALSDEDKGCQSESLKECEVRQFLERTRQACSCFPWALKNVVEVFFLYCHSNNCVTSLCGKYSYSHD